MSRKLHNLSALTLWHGGNDFPPATAKKQAKPKKEVLTLADAFMKAYSAPRRIA